MKHYFLIAVILLGAVLHPAFGEDLPPIDMAIISHDQKTAISLFKKGVSVDGSMTDGTPFIIEATRRSLTDLLSYLLDSGADARRRDKESNTALQVATRYKADSALPLLLSTKAFNINTPDKDGFTPLLYASTNRPEIVEMLIKAGADPNLPSSDSYKITPLERAAERGFADTLPALIKGGANVKGEAGSRAIKWASSYDTQNHAKAILVLARAGANLNGEPVWKCLEYNRYKCLRALLEGGADVNQRGFNEMTPLIHAVSIDGDIELVKIILAFDPNLEIKARFPFAVHGIPNIPFEERYNDATALMCAASDGKLELVKMLIYAGANPSTKDRHGRTALDIAKRSNRKDVVAYLETK